jgi:hypothetical protein|tara:strand:+ start:2179 stop:2547 length:369 start_codon:yes stop_codon:yes gene_type:complete
MADIGVYTTNAQIKVRAGTALSASGASVAETDKYVLAVEALINAKTKVNWSEQWATISGSATAAILTEASANLCAIHAIKQDMTGYATLAYATKTVDMCRDAHNRAMISLADVKVQEFLGVK